MLEDDRTLFNEMVDFVDSCYRQGYYKKEDNIVYFMNEYGFKGEYSELETIYEEAVNYLTY